MIKLNNKNITYVALADSNNSIKAPKEIWYADTNNSVKLVYQRKDALIEGEDYEKYHWLVTEIPNGNFMDLPLNTSNFSFKRIFCDMYNVNYFWSKDELYAYHHAYYHNRIWDIKNANGYWISSTSTSINNEVTISSTSEALEINGEEVPQVDYPPSIIKFRNANSPAATSIFKTSSITVDGIKHYVPVKLLKPVPKWLDANGIRRNVGECGMIDLVSGKFYGNVNSTGTFTVENYYERKEWLKVQTTTQTGTYLSLPLGTSKNFSFKRVWLSDFLNTWYLYTPGYIYYTDNHRLVLIWDSTNSTVVDSGDTSTINVGDVITIESTPNLLLINGKTINRYDYVSGVVNLTNAVALEITSLTSSITVDGAERYIPCTLTMDLPASMDANNIARTKGTSGMWDLVSDRFYGNVANSGTFKAVNLAEGVDYEVHQWLKTDLVGNKASMMRLPVNSSSFAFSRKMLSGTNVPYFYTEGGTHSDVYLNTSNNNTISIWNGEQGLYYVSGQSFDRNDAISIVSSTEGLIVNSQTIPQNTFPVQGISFGANDANGTENYTSSIYVDGIERYIPVKLLKSIPSKYDANGIARNAGECGMYDTVNDVFYGNVASSGTFSVSDDS